MGPLKEKDTHARTKTHWVNKQQRLKAGGWDERKQEEGKAISEFLIIPRRSSIATKEWRSGRTARRLTFHQETPRTATVALLKAIWASFFSSFAASPTEPPQYGARKRIQLRAGVRQREGCLKARRPPALSSGFHINLSALWKSPG